MYTYACVRVKFRGSNTNLFLFVILIWLPLVKKKLNSYIMIRGYNIVVLYFVYYILIETNH